MGWGSPRSPRRREDVHQPTRVCRCSRGGRRRGSVRTRPRRRPRNAHRGPGRRGAGPRPRRRDPRRAARVYDLVEAVVEDLAVSRPSSPRSPDGRARRRSSSNTSSLRHPARSPGGDQPRARPRAALLSTHRRRCGSSRSSGAATDPALVERGASLMRAWGRRRSSAPRRPGSSSTGSPTVLRRGAADAPGGLADAPTIDAAIAPAASPWDPSELTDFIGQDVNSPSAPRCGNRPVTIRDMHQPPSSGTSSGRVGSGARAVTASTGMTPQAP